MAVSSSSLPFYWTMFGTLGAIIFYGRFYVQWIYSEIKKRSAVPVLFWYMSSVGSVMQFVYAVVLRSPGMAFGQCFNIVIYARNLIHIWREKGKLTRTINVTVHALVAVIVLTSMAFMAWTWLSEYHATQHMTEPEARKNWIWLGVWAVGQALFSCRFLVQWIATEKKQKSVVPAAFWHISVVATLLQMASFMQRHEWIFAVGNAATMLVYLRNIWFIYTAPEETPEQSVSSS